VESESDLVPEKVLKAREEIDAATTTRSVREILEFVIGCPEGHAELVYKGADAKSDFELCGGGQHQFAAVAKRLLTAIMRVKVAGAEDRKGRPSIVAALQREFEMFECKMAAAGGRNFRNKLFGRLTDAGNPRLPAAGDEDTARGEEIHGAEEFRWPRGVGLNVLRHGVSCRRKGELNDCAEIAQKFPIWRLPNDRASGAEDGGIACGEQSAKDPFSYAVATFGGLKRIAHTAKVQGYATSKELSQNSGSSPSEGVLDPAKDGAGVCRTDGILGRIAAAISGEAVCASERAPTIGVEAKRKAAERELAGEGQRSGVGGGLAHFPLPRCELRTGGAGG
jgi:hypothetical protein